MLKFLSQVMNLINIHQTSQTAFLKRRIYGNYTSLSKRQYHEYVFWACIMDIVLLVGLYFVLSGISLFHGNDQWTLISRFKFGIILTLLILVLAFFVVLTYELLFYPRLYLEDARPTCCYLQKDTKHKAILITLYKDKALVEDIENGHSNDHYKLIELKRIEYVEKHPIDDKSALKHDLLKVWHTLGKLWTSLIEKILKPFYKMSNAKSKKMLERLKKENQALKSKVKPVIKDTKKKVDQKFNQKN